MRPCTLCRGGMVETTDMTHIREVGASYVTSRYGAVCPVCHGECQVPDTEAERVAFEDRERRRQQRMRRTIRGGTARPLTPLD